MGKLDEMRERLNRLEDVEILEVARDLLSDMAEVQNMKEQIKKREESFSKGKRAAFYFFAMGLDPDELSHAASTAKGRIRFLKEKQEREQAKAIRNGEISEDDIKNKKDDSSRKPKSSFGGLGSSFG